MSKQIGGFARRLLNNPDVQRVINEMYLDALIKQMFQKGVIDLKTMSDPEFLKAAIAYLEEQKAVPAAAAAGEEETRRVLLSAEQSDRAEDILQQDFVPPIQAYSLQVRTSPPTLTGVVYTSGQPHLVSHTLTEEEVLIILGPEEF